MADPDAIIDAEYDAERKRVSGGCCDQYSKPCDRHITYLNGFEQGLIRARRALTKCGLPDQEDA